jgi:uncharacterized protein (TIGR02646 family)
MLGPGSLNHIILRKIINQKKHKKLARMHNIGLIEWSDKSLYNLKKKIRITLRSQQEGRCIYCRRLIPIERRNAYEDIEHFLDKSKRYYLKWSFSCVNLILSCRACNVEKSTRDMGDAAIRSATAYTENAGNFQWIHPYFDDYHENIEISKGWLYTVKAGAPKASRAHALIKECKLDEVSRIESYSEEIKDKIYRLTILTGRLIRKQQYSRAQRLIKASQRLQEESWFCY